MPKIYQVQVKDTAGALKAIFTGERKGFYRFYYHRDLNTPGAFSIAFAKMASETEAEFVARTDHFELDGVVEFWWRWEEYDIDWRLDAAYLIRDRTWLFTAQGKLVYEIAGRGFVDLINRRVIQLGEDETSVALDEVNKSGVAETVIKEYVTEQAVVSDWARPVPGLSVEADQARGPEILASSLNRNLYQILYNTLLGISCFYDVVSIGDALYEFRFYYPLLGTDRREDVHFSPALGNMTQASLTLDQHDEITAVLVGGRGTERDRAYTWRTDDARIAQSPLNRIELFINANNANSATEYEEWGDRKLEDMRPQETLKFIALQTPGSLFGKHYFYGDLVSSQFMGIDQDKHVSGFSVVESSTRKSLSVEMRDA